MVITKSKREAVFARDNYRCRYCLPGMCPVPHDELDLGHVVPRSKGGSDETSNLIAQCRTTNRLIRATEFSPHPIVSGPNPIFQS